MGSWYLVRHGETEWNRIGRIQGHSDVPLTETGRRQARLLARRLADSTFDAVYTSDLSRAVETAETIARHSKTEVLADRLLREFSYGEWEGMTLDEVKRRDPAGYSRQTNLAAHAFAAPGGEDTAELLARVRRFYLHAVERHAAVENLLIVAHGGTIRALLVCLMEWSDDQFWRFMVDCGALAVISNQPGGRILERWNQTC